MNILDRLDELHEKMETPAEKFNSAYSQTRHEYSSALMNSYPQLRAAILAGEELAIMVEEMTGGDHGEGQTTSDKIWWSQRDEALATYRKNLDDKITE